jgi:hypothetical protein
MTVHDRWNTHACSLFFTQLLVTVFLTRVETPTMLEINVVNTNKPRLQSVSHSALGINILDPCRVSDGIRFA